MPVAGDDPTKMRGRPSLGWRLLAFWDGGSSAHEIADDARIVIGRAEECDVRIPHESVSRRHAALTRHLRHWRIEDLGSSNGTIVGGVSLGARQARVVEAATVVALGDARIVLDGGGAADGMRPSQSPAPVARGLGEAMERLIRLVDLVADSKLPVLLLGETGVGKGRLAEEIHRRSSRGAAPLLRLNCAAVPESLLESELFGHERGAFTGAVQAKAGLLETASGSTVFLDEIGEVPRATQAKLLHVLEHDEVMRLGATRPRTIDVRFVAATNREIEELVGAGQFRKDLYFRLADVPLRVPPLRQRTGEIPAMARGFIEEACAGAGRPVPRISPEAMARLERHGWTGNIRELRNVVMRAALLSAGHTVRLEHLLLDGPGGEIAIVPTSLEPPARTTRSLESELRDFERQTILDTLRMYDGHQGKTAKHLGISRRTLTKKLGVHDLPRPRKR